MNSSDLSRFLGDCREHVSDVRPWLIAGRLTRINGLVMEASGLKLPLGSGCLIQIPGNGTVEAEVVGFAGDRLFMMPAEDVTGFRQAHW
jgi:flagellum-specific ATP synthase